MVGSVIVESGDRANVIGLFELDDRIERIEDSAGGADLDKGRAATITPPSSERDIGDWIMGFLPTLDQFSCR